MARPKKITHEMIAQRAYELFECRGCEHGYDVKDWNQAEQELRQERILRTKNAQSIQEVVIQTTNHETGGRLFESDEI
jgi:hypothetical protein